MPSSGLELTFPSEGNYNINWGDGNAEAITASNPTHTYAVAGNYTVTASNTITRFNLNNGVSKAKLTDVSQWGTANWNSMQGAFWGATALTTISASDKPNLAGVTDMSSMFRTATAFNGNISNWDVSNVTSMSQMFQSASLFNANIGNWDVSNVEDMRAMFAAAPAFNGNIGSWNVSSVTDMSNMFYNSTNTTVFNQNIGNWNVSSVTTMKSMFESSTVFNQDISKWDVSSVENMNVMFGGAKVFNQDISKWNVSSVTDMTDMFNFADAFNQNLGRWYAVPTVGFTISQTGFNIILAAQNTVLRGQNPTYTLPDGTGDNALFTLNPTTLTISPNSNTPFGTYSLHIAVSKSVNGSNLFGSNNTLILSIDYSSSIDYRDPNFITQWRIPASDLTLTFPGGWWSIFVNGILSL